MQFQVSLRKVKTSKRLILHLVITIYNQFPYFLNQSSSNSSVVIYITSFEFMNR